MSRMNRLTGGVKILVVQRCQQRLTRTLLNQVLPGLTDRIDELRVGRQIIAEDFLERQQSLYAAFGFRHFKERFFLPKMRFKLHSETNKKVRSKFTWFLTALCCLELEAFF